MEKSKKIFLICLITILTGILICYTFFDIDIIKIIESESSKQPAFVGITWREVDDSYEFISFEEDGSFSAGNGISGNPSYASDICERYEYNPSKKEITILCGENNRKSTVFYIEYINKRKGILKLRVYDSVIEYVADID